jgi:hypothetical protein
MSDGVTLALQFLRWRCVGGAWVRKQCFGHVDCPKSGGQLAELYLSDAVEMVGLGCVVMTAVDWSRRSMMEEVDSGLLGAMSKELETRDKEM